MWRFYSISGALLSLLLALILLPLPERQFILLASASGLVWLMTVIFGVSRISSGMFIRAECRREGAGNRVALTFDDGPHGPATEKILKILDRYGAGATFFIIGRKAEADGDTIRKVRAAGHELGNHTWSHSYFFPMFRGARIAAEIRQTNELLKNTCGEEPSWFRPPFGVSNPNLNRGLKLNPMKVAGWSIRSFDTRNEPSEKVVRRISRKIRGGDIILLHESSRNITEILESLLELMKERGLVSVSMDTLFDRP